MLEKMISMIEEDIKNLTLRIEETAKQNSFFNGMKAFAEGALKKAIELKDTVVESLDKEDSNDSSMEGPVAPVAPVAPETVTDLPIDTENKVE